ncbi:MAG: VanZ family protein [Clostridia bacterium]|nr:VanZ family protein [Clostridia bacterium]
MKRKWVWRVLVFLWCAMIFYQSGKIAEVSSEESSNIMTIVNSGIQKLTGSAQFGVSERFIRKAGHFLEYLILGVFLYGAISSPTRKAKGLWLPFSTGVLYAATDELHQYFVPGRSMRIFDLGIDALGLLAGVILACFLIKRVKPL